MTEKVKIVTLGCEKNLVDSEIMSGLIDQRGYSLVDNREDATVIIVNTCGFIDAAKEESVNTILELADLKESGRLKALIVSGCLTQRYKQTLMEEMPEIDGIVGTGDFTISTGSWMKPSRARSRRWSATLSLIMSRRCRASCLRPGTRPT
ncbi:hypothetical protein HMSSN139_33440 [Paenibacillus sp. HMSSN-139]|nr:hypothetical protein HMSSN139_33440 [Paenibacillus sp. HMSSN-139]